MDKENNVAYAIYAGVAMISSALIFSHDLINFIAIHPYN